MKSTNTKEKTYDHPMFVFVDHSALLIIDYCVVCRHLLNKRSFDRTCFLKPSENKILHNNCTHQFIFYFCPQMKRLGNS